MAKTPEKSLINQAAELAESMRPTIESAVAAAKETALPLLADVKEAAAPLLAEGKALAAEKAAATKGLAAAAAASMASAAEAPAAAEGTDGKRHWLRKLLVLGGLAALGALAYQKLRGPAEEDNWQSSYVPTPAPGSATPQAADDASGATPDEAASDALEEPHAVTTPDEPAEVVEIDESDADESEGEGEGEGEGEEESGESTKAPRP